MKIWYREFFWFLFYSTWAYLIVLFPIWGGITYLIGVLINYSEVYGVEQHKISQLRSNNPILTSVFFLPFKILYHFMNFLMFLLR